MTPNPSLERDLHRHGTWPARRCGPSSVARAKCHPGVGPSAQTLGGTAPTQVPRKSCTVTTRTSRAGGPAISGPNFAICSLK